MEIPKLVNAVNIPTIPEQDTMTIHGGWYAVAGVTLAAFLWWVLNTGGYLG